MEPVKRIEYFSVQLSVLPDIRSGFLEDVERAKKRIEGRKEPEWTYETKKTPKDLRTVMDAAHKSAVQLRANRDFQALLDQLDPNATPEETRACVSFEPKHLYLTNACQIAVVWPLTENPVQFVTFAGDHLQDMANLRCISNYQITGSFLVPPSSKFRVGAQVFIAVIDAHELARENKSIYAMSD